MKEMYKKEEDKRSGDVPKDGQGPNEGKNQFVREVAHKKYEYGFSTDVQTEIIERGLNEDAGFPLLADAETAVVGAFEDAGDRLPGHFLLC